MKIRGDRGEALCTGNLTGGLEISLNSQSVVAAVNCLRCTILASFNGNSKGSR